MNQFEPSKEDVLRKFFALGYFQGQEWDSVRTFVLGDVAVKEAVEKFRDFHGLPTGDSVDDTVLNNLMARRCALPDLVRPAEAGLCKWPMLQVTTAHRIEGLKPLDSSIEQAVWQEALAAWNAVCGLELSLIDDIDLANIYANVGSMSGSTLAYSYLPCGATQSTRLAQSYNRATDWTRNLLLNVAIHEIGHAIGLDHGPSGSIMMPTANGSITRPQSWDINQVVSRYGKPKPKPQPEPPTPQPPRDGVRIVIPGDLKAGEYILSPANAGWELNP